MGEIDPWIFIDRLIFFFLSLSHTIDLALYYCAPFCAHRFKISSLKSTFRIIFRFYKLWLWFFIERKVSKWKKKQQTVNNIKKNKFHGNVCEIKSISNERKKIAAKLKKSFTTHLYIEYNYAKCYEPNGNRHIHVHNICIHPQQQQTFIAYTIHCGVFKCGARMRVAFST